MSEAVVVGIISVAVVAFIACAGAIWRLAGANAEKATQIATLKGELAEMKTDVAVRLARSEAAVEDRIEALGTSLAEKIDAVRRENEKLTLAAELRRTEADSRWLSFTEKLSTITGLLSAHPPQR